MTEKALSPEEDFKWEYAQNARRMLHLTNQLLDFRKIQSNKMVLKIREIDIVAFTKEIFESFGPLASTKE